MNDVIRLKRKITKAEVVTEKFKNHLEEMHEGVKRPETLRGTTYKITTPMYNHAVYITMNDIVLNKGTDHEIVRPFEMFINSKNMENFQWIVALTRIISAVFRKGGELTFLIEELKSVFDPRGGYYKKGGRYVVSLVAEIGDVVERHLTELGILEVSNQIQIKDTKVKTVGPATFQGEICPACGQPSLHRQEGCKTCTCGYSQC